jgi:diadenosine tetraphosphate (Ap4A) HIT family hydrolase
MADPPVADCLFCDPAEQARALASNGTAYARWDNYPATPGHVEVVTLRHVESFFGLTAQEITDLHDLLNTVHDQLAEDYAPDGWNIGVNDGAAAGRTIDHLHIHLIPRYRNDVPDPRGGIRRGLPNGDPDKWMAHESCAVASDDHHRKDT